MFVVFLSHVCVVTAAEHKDIAFPTEVQSEAQDHQHNGMHHGVHLAGCHTDTPTISKAPVELATTIDVSPIAIVLVPVSSEIVGELITKDGKPPRFLLHRSLLI
ncbi:MAG TPA: hypothetical protein VJO34_06445 [Methylomirabilota bacterium]|nr:hypothetical protein [Methylomirabilota bacterium]